LIITWSYLLVVNYLPFPLNRFNEWYFAYKKPLDLNHKQNELKILQIIETQDTYSKVVQKQNR